MKIKKIIIFLFILIFIILLPSLLFYVSNLAFWPGENYIFANNINKKLEKIFTKNDLLKLKKWDFYYKLWEYKDALEKYSQAKCLNNKTCFILNHNVWNTYYKLWEFEAEKLRKISLWQSSLSFYTKALNVKQDIQTKKNYDFVLEELRKLMKEDEEKKEEEKEEDKQSQEKNEKQDENNDQENNNEETEQITPKAESMKISEEHENAKESLTKEELEALEKYIESLKQEEKQNIELNKPKKSNDIFDILSDDFMFGDFDRNENDW